ncbi:hypothetical protein ACFYZJ_13950 [Streptomyces sp. NPDC001848]|uniref:hypothetical protein n=1 Tax=Streptomyces sp. NPDC001848 TaxID=3364618 RepID=UPI0036B0DF1A
MAVHSFGSPRPARYGAEFCQARLTVPLQAGSYELWCSLAEHRELSMDTHLQVGGNGPASPAPGGAAATATGQ